MKLNRLFATLASVAALSVCQAEAGVYTEVGDAGITVATAQGVGSNTTQINGALHYNDGADVYKFNWNGGVFSADTYGSPFDTMLHLFDMSGNVIAFNDDYPWCCNSYISTGLASGQYLLGITYFPNNYWGNLGGYSNNGYDASYVIHTSAISSSVPEPTGLALLGLGLVGLGMSRKRAAK